MTTAQLQSKPRRPELTSSPGAQRARRRNRTGTSEGWREGRWIGAVAAVLLALTVLAAVSACVGLALGAAFAKALFGIFLLLFFSVLVLSLLVRYETEKDEV